jgi:hypothetical protein
MASNVTGRNIHMNTEKVRHGFYLSRREFVLLALGFGCELVIPPTGNVDALEDWVHSGVNWIEQLRQENIYDRFKRFQEDPAGYNADGFHGKEWREQNQAILSPERIGDEPVIADLLSGFFNVPSVGSMIVVHRCNSREAIHVTRSDPQTYNGVEFDCWLNSCGDVVFSHARPDNSPHSNVVRFDDDCLRWLRGSPQVFKFELKELAAGIPLVEMLSGEDMKVMLNAQPFDHGLHLKTDGYPDAFLSMCLDLWNSGTTVAMDITIPVEGITVFTEQHARTVLEYLWRFPGLRIANFPAWYISDHIDDPGFSCLLEDPKLIIEVWDSNPLINQTYLRQLFRTNPARFIYNITVDPDNQLFREDR